MNRLQLIGVILIGFLGQGCASFIGMQTAEVLDAGEVQTTQGAVMAYSLPQVELNDYDEINQLVPFFLIRKGIANRSEFQSMITPNSLNVSYKHLFSESDKLRLAYAGGVGYTFLASSFDDQLHIVDVPLVLFSTFRFSEKTALTFAPRVTPRFLGQTFSLVGGGSFTFSFGKNVRIMPETSFSYDIQQQNIFITGGIGFAF